jgi:hypothetical protein
MLIKGLDIGGTCKMLWSYKGVEVVDKISEPV